MDKTQRQIATTALLLMVFATIGAAVVGFTFDQTEDRIELNRQRVLLQRLNTILPAERYDNDLLQDQFTLPPQTMLGTSTDETAYLATRAGEAVGVVLPAIAPNGYNGSIYLLVGIYADGTLAGVRVTRHRETPGLGDAIEETRSDWILGFAGRSLGDPVSKRWKVKRDGGDFDQFTGATITPRAVVKAVHSALVYFDENRESLLQQDSDR